MTSTHVHPGSIVVGVDGSPCSDRALAWSAEQASVEGRPLVLLHGTGPGGSPWMDAYGLDPVRVTEAFTAAGARLLARACGRVRSDFTDLDVRTLLVETDPRSALLEAAAHASMLVVGSRGLGPVGRLVLGSVSAAVSRHASCPTAVVRPHEEGVLAGGVLVGVDAGGRSAGAVDLAFRLASSRGVPLTVMHCSLDLTGTVPEPFEIAWDTPGHETSRLVLDGAVAGLRETFPDVEVALVIGRGLVEDSLVRASGRMDVVVVGAHHVGVLGALLDLHPDRTLVTRASSVVVVVPEPGH